MLEALVLPGLFLSIIGFIAYVMFAWLRKPEDRALGRFSDDAVLDEEPGAD